MKTKVTLNVNGQERTAEVEPRTLLVELLQLLRAQRVRPNSQFTQRMLGIHGFLRLRAFRRS